MQKLHLILSFTLKPDSLFCFVDLEILTAKSNEEVEANTDVTDVTDH